MDFLIGLEKKDLSEAIAALKHLADSEGERVSKENMDNLTEEQKKALSNFIRPQTVTPGKAKK